MEIKCVNILYAIAQTEAAENQLREFIKNSKTEKYLFDLEGTFPVPDQIKDIQEPIKNGSNSEYDADSEADRIAPESAGRWKEINWNTAIFDDPIIRKDSSNYFCVSFYTRETRPIFWLEKVSKDYPLIDFKIMWDMPFGSSGISDAFDGNVISYHDHVVWSD